MKKIIVAIAVSALGLGSAGVSLVSAASGTTPRADGYVEIWCDSDATNLDGTGPGSVTPGNSGPEGGDEDDVLAKRVDVRAIQPDKDPGGKDTATARYNATAGVVQGWFCADREARQPLPRMIGVRGQRPRIVGRWARGIDFEVIAKNTAVPTHAINESDRGRGSR